MSSELCCDCACDLRTKRFEWQSHKRFSQTTKWPRTLSIGSSTSSMLPSPSLSMRTMLSASKISLQKFSILFSFFHDFLHFFFQSLLSSLFSLLNQRHFSSSLIQFPLSLTLTSIQLLLFLSFFFLLCFLHHDTTAPGSAGGDLTHIAQPRHSRILWHYLLPHWYTLSLFLLFLSFHFLFIFYIVSLRLFSSFF